MTTLIAYALGALLLGSLVYCALTIIAAHRYLAVKPPPCATDIPISVLKPLSGAEDGLEENLRTFFTQHYGDYEIIFAVRTLDDAAAQVVERLQRQYPKRTSKLLITGEPNYANAKVFSLDQMMRAARHDLLVMSDSDIRVDSGMLATLAAEFAQDTVDLATCPYRAVPGGSFWSVLEAIGMNTEFLGGILVARMLDGMKFAVGPTIAARRSVIERIGGFDRLKDYLAEDFVMGKFASEAGFGVILSSYVIEHRIGGGGFVENARHRLRWARSTRRSRPAGYAGQLFTNPLPLAVLFVLLQPGWWAVLVMTAVMRAAAAYAVSEGVLRDPLCRSKWWLIPIQDIVSFLFWLAGFWGNTIVWRGRVYELFRDGRFAPRS